MNADSFFGDYDPESTFLLLAMGKADPCLQIDSGGQIQFATQTPQGPVAGTLSVDGNEIASNLVGPAADVFRPFVGDFMGLNFTPPQIESPPKLRRLAAKHSGMRVPKLPVVSMRLVQIILQQLISYRDACYGWRKLVHRYGSPVEDYPNLWYPPTPKQIRKLASHEFIECGIPPKHGRRIADAMRYADRLETLWAGGRSEESTEQVCRLLSKLPGIGPWTIGFLRGAGMGDADAEILGDYGHPKHVSYFFTGQTDGSDEEMLRLLEPYRPHRCYVLSLLIKGAPTPPRRGSKRRSLRDQYGF